MSEHVRAKTWPRAMPALITPFGPDGSVSLDDHQHNVEHLMSVGASGVVVAGSTGEGPYLSHDERTNLTRTAADVAADLTVVTGINAESVLDAVRQGSDAAQAGAHAALILTPTTLIRGKDGAVARYFLAVADALPIPVFLYSNPNVTAYDLPTDVVADLAGHDNIVGMKDSGGDPGRLPRISAAIADGFIVYAGASRALHASRFAGAYGAITASANYVFPIVDEAAQSSESAQSELTLITSPIERHGIAGSKYAATQMGLKGADVRAPLQPLSDETRRIIDDTLDRFAQR